MVGTLLSFSAMALSVRGLAGKFSIFEILTIRTGVGLLILIGVGLAQPALLRSISLRRFGMQIARNATHFTGQYLWALSLTLLPLATVFALEFTMPAWTILLAILFLGETMNRGRVGSVICGFIGVLVILRPGIAAFNPASLLTLAAAFCYATSNVFTKKLTVTETTFAIVFWMNLIQMPLGYIGSDPLFFLKIDAHTLIPALAIGISGLSAHYCLTNALAIADATVVVPLDFMRLPLIAIVGWMFYGEQLDLLVFAGAAVIIAGVLWGLKSEARKAGKVPASASPAAALDSE
jgi:drug/metabolite transporter (DMT)-like permease